MKSLLRNILLSLGIALILLVFAWVYLRGHALSKPVRRPIEHPVLAWLATHHVAAYRGADFDRPENTMAAFAHAYETNPDILLWVDVRPSHDGTLYVFNDRDLSSTTNGRGWISMTADVDIATLDAGYQFKNEKGEFEYRGKGLKIPTLVEVLKAFPKAHFVLNFHDYQNGMDVPIVSAITQTDSASRVLITSPEDAALRDLRDKRPDWVFGTSQAEATRIKMLSAFALEAVPPLRGDVFTVEKPQVATHVKYPILSKAILDEIHRREMIAIAGPAENSEERAQLQKEGVDIVLIRRMTDAY